MGDAASMSTWHDTFGAPKEDVVAFVQRSTGTAPSSLERLTVGDENEVYRTHLDASTVYVRIRRPDTTGFAPELWAMDQARAAGIPVPTVLATGVIESTNERPREAMVINAARGNQLAGQLPSFNAADRHSILHDLGAVVARLHAIPTPGTGRLDPSGTWPDVGEEAHRFISRCRDQLTQLNPAGLRKDEIDRIAQLIGTSPDTPTRANPVICHGDLHAAHVFVVDLQITGIIDWGLCHGGSSIDDLASMLLLYDAPDFDTILAGHGTPEDVGGDLHHRLALSVVNQAIGHIAWHVHIGNHAGIDHYVGRMRNALAELADTTDQTSCRP